jgi:prepilin-type N-terminal cleavage/methylation domain-containing protein
MITAKHITSQLQKGFTLIELLVVIGILGILAAALVATIDPFEQLRKAQDTNMKNISVEFLNAKTRYYTNHNALPWYSTASGGANCYSANSLATPGVALSSLSTCITTLVTDGELKQGFSTSTYLTSIYATNAANSTDISVCFKPTSRTQQKDAGTKYNQDGTAATAGTCKSSGGTTDCYWCAQ